MVIKVKCLERFLKKEGFTQRTKPSSHSRWTHPDGRKTTISSHGCNKIYGKVLRKILKDIGLSLSDFKKKLK